MEKHKYIETPEALEKLLQLGSINNSILFLGATMATIAAINSLEGPGLFFKILVFMFIGLGGLLIYKGKFQ